MRFYISTTHGDDRNPGNTLLPWRTEDHARRQVNELEDEVMIDYGHGYVPLGLKPPLHDR